jgi:hypothetical protein
MTYEELTALPEEARKEAMAKAFHEKNTEAQGLRNRLKKDNPKALEAYERLKAEFGVDELDDAFIESLKSATNKTMSMEERLKVMERSLAKANGDKEALSNQLTQSEKKQLERERDGLILSELGKIGIRSDEMQDQIKLASLSAVYDGDTQKWSFNGKDLAVYAGDLAKSKPYLVGNPVKGGTGNSGAPNVQGGSTDGFISEAEYMAMTLDQQRSPEIRAKARASMDKWVK